MNFLQKLDFKFTILNEYKNLPIRLFLKSIGNTLCYLIIL